MYLKISTFILLNLSILSFNSAIANSTLDCLLKDLRPEIQFTNSVYTEIDANSSVEKISLFYRNLKKGNEPIEKNIESQRLINQDDWEVARKEMGNKAWQYYGDKTIEDWFKGLAYVDSLPANLTLDSKLFKKIHQIVTQNHKFHGYEGRRIREKYDSGKISKEEFTNQLNRAYQKNESVSGVNHDELKGHYRKDKVDQILHSGSSFDSNGKRYFTSRELNQIRDNQFMTVDESTIVKKGEDAYTGRAYYHDVSKVEKSVDKVLARTNKKLKKAKNPIEVIKIVIQMEKDLISIHPFLDGNGRTVRLLGDYILKRNNIPPSLYPNESDLVMSLDEATEFQLEGMRSYLKELQRSYLNRLD